VSSAAAYAAAQPPADAHINRLTLRVAGLDEDAARALARLVAEGLSPGMLRPAGTAGLDFLQVEVNAGPAELDSPGLLAQRIVAEIGRALARDRLAGGPDGEAVP
jgi:hypothetical protein